VAAPAISVLLIKARLLIPFIFFIIRQTDFPYAI
jgi:hypothetical protein